MWGECQVQKKKNSHNYKRNKDYLFLQKLKCPHCNRILAGKATRKKNGSIYYYYYCHDCKINIKETDIEKEIIDKTIKYLEYKIRDCDVCNELRFTPEDILIKRDLDYINQIVYPEEYEKHTYMWKDYIREEKSDLIMRYVGNVELTLYGKNKVKIGEVFFRESMCKPCNDLYDSGFLAKKDYAILGNIGMKLRFSEYLPIEKVSEVVFTLRQYYNVGYFEATYYYDNKVMFFNAIQNVKQLGKVNHHNLRQYDNNQELIKTIKVSNDIVKDVKELYLDLFEESRLEYNKKQTRDDRTIDNYFNKISNDTKHDMACAIVIELGNMEYWNEKSLEYKYEMTQVFEKQP